MRTLQPSMNRQARCCLTILVGANLVLGALGGVPTGLGGKEAYEQEANRAIWESYRRGREADLERRLRFIEGGGDPTDVLVMTGAFSSLGLSPEEAAAVYGRLLNHSSDDVKQVALQAVADFGAPLCVLSPVLIEHVTDKGGNLSVRILAVRCLGRIGACSSGIAEILIAQMDGSATPGFKVALADSVGQLGLSAISAEPVLVRWLREPDTRSQFASFKALGRIRSLVDRHSGRPPHEHPDRIEEELGEARVLVEIQNAMTNDPQTAGVVARAAGQSARPYLQALAVDTFGIIPAQNEPAINALLNAVGSNDPFISDLAVQACRRSQARDSKCLSVLSSALASPNPRVRYVAALGLRNCGAAAATAVPAIATALRRVDNQTSHFEIGAYLDVLRAIGPEASAAGDAILAMMPEQSQTFRGYGKFELHYLRAYLLVTLTDIGRARDGLPFIYDALANSDRRSTHLFAAGARAAASLGRDVGEAVPLLNRALISPASAMPISFESYFSKFTAADKYTSPLVEAVRALGAIGPESAISTPLLESLARQVDSSAELVPNAPAEARKALLKVRGD